MVGVAFYFEHNDIDVYSGRAIDLDAWNIASKISGDITEMLIVNRTEQKLNTPDTQLVFSVVDKLPILENAIYLDPTKGTSLWDLDHSPVEWYVFGPASGWDHQADPTKRYIHIPTMMNVHCHSQHVMTAVMYHRYGTMN